MAYSVIFGKPMSEVPAEIKRRLSTSLVEIGEVCKTIPTTSIFWASMKQSGLVLDIGAWRFEYKLDIPRKRIVVVDYRELRS